MEESQGSEHYNAPFLGNVPGGNDTSPGAELSSHESFSTETSGELTFES